MINEDRPSVSEFDEKTRKFTTSKTVNILNDPNLMTLKNHHNWERYELARRHEHSFLQKLTSPILARSSASSIGTNETSSVDDLLDDLRLLIEQRLPDLCYLDGETISFTRGDKFNCTIKDILTSDGEFWAERQLSEENEEKFRSFIEILSLVAVSYESLKEVHVGQLVGLHYESSWHRALVVSKSEGTKGERPASARVRLVDYGSSLYVNVSQLKWLPEQFYSFPFKAVECVFSEAVKPTFSDTVRLTFKQLVLNKRLRAKVYDRDGTRLCVVLKCRTDEGVVNVYRYLRAHEHKSKTGRMLADGDVVSCLRDTILNQSHSFDQSSVSNRTFSMTLPILNPPASIRMTTNQIDQRRAQIKRIAQETCDEASHHINHSITDNSKITSAQSTPFSSGTVITPMPYLSFAHE